MYTKHRCLFELLIYDNCVSNLTQHEVYYCTFEPSKIIQIFLINTKNTIVRSKSSNGDHWNRLSFFPGVTLSMYAVICPA